MSSDDQLSVWLVVGTILFIIITSISIILCCLYRERAFRRASRNNRAVQSQFDLSSLPPTQQQAECPTQLQQEWPTQLQQEWPTQQERHTTAEPQHPPPVTPSAPPAELVFDEVEYGEVIQLSAWMNEYYGLGDQGERIGTYDPSAGSDSRQSTVAISFDQENPACARNRNRNDPPERSVLKDTAPAPEREGGLERLLPGDHRYLDHEYENLPPAGNEARSRGNDNLGADLPAENTADK